MIYYPKRIYHMDCSHVDVQDEAQHKAKGDGWFESPATARDALKQLARSKPPLESLRSSENHRLIDAVYEILYKDAKGPEQWEVIRDYMNNFPAAAFKSTWAKELIPLIPNTIPAGESKTEATNLPRRASRRDLVKEKIAELKRDYSGISQLEICRNLDQHNDRANKPLSTLEDWQKLSHDRTWEGNLTNPKTKNRVKRFISGIPPA